MNRTDVVAALIKDDQGKILICQRPLSKKRGGLWEFVGGKVEEGESKSQALIRECREELEIDIEPGTTFVEVDHTYPDINIHLSLINSKIKSGDIVLKEHLDYKWVLPEDLNNYSFCPADTQIIDLLQKSNY